MDSLASNVKDMRAYIWRTSSGEMLMAADVMVGAAQIADSMGISPSGVKQLIDAGRLPEPDATVGDRPLWLLRTFSAWLAGYQAGQRSKRPAPTRDGLS